MDAASIMKKRKTHFIAGLWLLIGPTALLIVGFLAFAIINWISAGITPPPAIDCPVDGPASINAAVDCSASPESLFGGTSTASSVANIIMFLISVIGIITWLPGLIIGIVLLATMPPKPIEQG